MTVNSSLSRLNVTKNVRLVLIHKLWGGESINELH